MTPKGKETARWIGMILALIISVSGWLYASAIHIQIGQAEKLAHSVEQNTTRLEQVETNIAVLETNIMYIKEGISEIKAILNKDKK